MQPNSLEGCTILLTGGTGTFGKAFVEQVLNNHRPKAIRILSRDELKQYEMKEALPSDDRLRFFVGDVRDQDRLRRAMKGCDVVVHAAALKQVTTCEYNPFEAVKTNIFGAQNIIETAIDLGVPKAISLSTDKAVNPVNLYGATKLCAEKLFTQGNAYAAEGPTRFASVRYGNVVGSRGSVVEVFQRQRPTGVLTITDERMTRFWITQRQAAQFVIDCLSRMVGGEVFVPKLPTMRVVDLAQAMAPEAELKVVGIRPGEKLHEVLLMEQEAQYTEEHQDLYVIRPQFKFWDLKHDDLLDGSPVPEGFRYASDDSPWRLTPKEICEIVQDITKTL